MSTSHTPLPTTKYAQCAIAAPTGPQRFTVGLL